MYNFILNRLSNHRANALTPLLALLLLSHTRYMLGFLNAPNKKAYQLLLITCIKNKYFERTAFTPRLFFSSS